MSLVTASDQVEIQSPEPSSEGPNDDTIPQIIMADQQFNEITDRKYDSKASVYKLKYLKAKKEYYYKS